MSTTINDRSETDLQEPFAQQREQLRLKRERQLAERPKIIADGVEALTRLVKLAQSDTGQCKTIAKFCLAIYNDQRFPFPLTELRGIDEELYIDCMAVLKMDARACEKEVHLYFENGGLLFERIAADWGFVDHRKMTAAVRDAGVFGSCLSGTSE